MAYWAAPRNQHMYNLKGFDENDLVMGAMLSQKPGYDLMQNCDLPPPTKVFSGLSDNATVISPIKTRKKINSLVDDHDHEVNTDSGDSKLGLLKALRLSQTRAREAEANYRAITKERDMLALAFMQDSMHIFAYRQFVRLLEFQVSQFQKQQKACCHSGKQEQEDEVDDGNGSSGLTFLMTMAFYLGIAGVGLAIGCKYLYSN